MPDTNFAMPDYSFGTLDRCDAVPKLLENPQDFLFVAGLAGTAKDIAHLCEPLPNYYACAGVMGGATMMGLGLALAQPGKRVVVATGDGELLMNLGSLATVAVMRPTNLAILCVDNGQRCGSRCHCHWLRHSCGAHRQQRRRHSRSGLADSAGGRSVFYPSQGQAHGPSQGSTSHGCHVDQESLL
jgi:hypothetical protein